MDGLRLDEILVKKLTGRKKVFRLDHNNLVQRGGSLR
jgi:hypothetical protein